LCPAAQTTLRGFKIIIESKFNNNHLKFNCDFKIHMAFEMITQKKKKKKISFIRLQSLIHLYKRFANPPLNFLDHIWVLQI
jgi:hypothetical protein